jgi:transposase
MVRQSIFLERGLTLSTRIDFTPLDTATYTQLVQRFNATTHPETRLRYQIILLAHQDYSNAQIASVVLRSRDTVERVLNRFRIGGLDAVPYKKPGRAKSKVTPEWKAELERVIELDPHSVGVPSANWTTQLLAEHLRQRTGLTLSQATVGRHLHQAGFVCKRPTWTLKHKAKEQADYLGNACGWKRS